MEPNNDQDLNNQTQTAPTQEGTNPPTPEAVSEPTPTPEPTSAPAPESQAQTSIIEETVVADSKPTKTKSWIILVVIFAVLAAVGIGFGIWAIIDGGQKPAPAPTTPTDPDSPSSTPTEPTDTSEVELTDHYDFDEKIALLHRTTQTGPIIEINAGTHPEFELYEDDGLSDQSKIIITMNALPVGMATYPTGNVLDSIESDFPDLFEYDRLQYVQEELNGHIFKKDIVEAKHREIFGTDLVYDQNAETCPMVYRNSEYYFTLAWCGGTSSLMARYYKNRYTTDGDHVYVYINAGVANAETSKIYCKVYPYYTVVDRQYDDESLACDNYNGDFTIDATNRNQFAEYRFVFKKAADGTYYFEKVEKIS